MATQVQFRRDTTANLAGVTPALGEIGVDTTRKGFIIGDAIMAGGIVTPNVYESQKQTHRFAVGGGTGNAVTIALSPAPTIVAGFKVKWQQPANNTGAVTLNVNGGGAVALKKQATVALAADDLLEDGIYEATHDGTNFQLAQSVGTSAGSGLVLLQEQALTAVAVADFTGVFSPTDYIGYKLKGWARPATDGVRPIIQYSEAASFVETGYSCEHLDNAANWVAGSSDGSMLPGGTNELQVGNDADNAFEFEFEFGDMDGTRRWAMRGWQTWIGSEPTGTHYGPAPARSKNTASPVVDGLRVKFHSGNIAAIVAGLYGYARS